MGYNPHEHVFVNYMILNACVKTTNVYMQKDFNNFRL